MSKEKRYYWLKQPIDFFNNAKIKKLRRIAGGDTYTIIYQKIMLLSIVNGGLITYEGVEPTLHEELSLILDESEENVQVTINFMESQGLIEDLGGNEFLLPQVPKLIGSESSSAKRVRELRDRKNTEALQCNDNLGGNSIKALQCNNDVTESNANVTTCNANVTQRREEKRREEKSRYREDIEKIIKDLNNKAGTNFKPNTKNTVSLIEARIKEGYSIDDFYRVNSNKCLDWLGTDMQKYLVPNTIYSGKFEGYLNQLPSIKDQRRAVAKHIQDNKIDPYQLLKAN